MVEMIEVLRSRKVEEEPLIIIIVPQTINLTRVPTLEQ
jgi:hypothetical protein